MSTDKYRDRDKNFRMEAGAERVLYGLNDIELHSGIADSPTRTAPPDENGRPFGELPEREQLFLLARLYDRNSTYADAIVEAVAEAEDSDRLLKAALDPDVTHADLGRRFRECLIGYCESVAAHRGDELTEL